MRSRLVLLLTMTMGPVLAEASTNELLQVFDQELYDTKIQPAFDAFARGRDDAPLRALLRETLERLRSKPLPPRYASEKETPREALARMLAMLKGDTSFDSEYLVLTKDRGVVPLMNGRPVPRAEAIQQMVNTEAFPLLIDVLCVQRIAGAPAELVLWDSPLSGYLYARSPWIKRAFDGFSPPTYASFELSMGEATGVIAPWWVSRFEVELRRVPRPSTGAEAIRDYDLLLKMVEMVRLRPSLRLVSEVG